MPKIRIARRVAAAVLAATLALGGAVGLGAAGADDHLETPSTEQVGATWSLTDDDDKGRIGAYGSTWS